MKADLRRESLSVVDTAWLKMDRPTNLMMICGMMMFAGHIELNGLRRLIGERMLCFHRFRQRVARDSGGAWWESDPHFDLAWHVLRLPFPEAADAAALEEAVSDLISTPLDPGRPMWQFHLIDTAGGSVLLLRIHHCYGDGFALLHVVNAMSDLDPAHPGAPAGDLGEAEAPRAAWERIFGAPSEALGDVIRNSLAVADEGRRLLLHPLRALGYLETGGKLARETAVIATMTPDSPTRFKGALGVMKRVAWARPLSLFEVKAVAGALGCSVNDVLVGCISGALRNYLLAEGDAVDKVDVRALVPVNLRPPGPVTALGNRFGMVFLSLPLGVADPVARVREVQRRMNALKDSRQSLVALGILAAMGVAPDTIRERTLEALAANASMVITNVHGAEQPRHLAGVRIVRQMFWVPQSGGIGIGISLLSYGGEVSFGIVSDRRRVADPHTIAAQFAGEFETLLLTSLMMPWPGELLGDAGN